MDLPCSSTIVMKLHVRTCTCTCMWHSLEKRKVGGGPGGGPGGFRLPSSLLSSLSSSAGLPTKQTNKQTNKQQIGKRILTCTASINYTLSPTYISTADTDPCFELSCICMHALIVHAYNFAGHNFFFLWNARAT